MSQLNGEAFIDIRYVAAAGNVEKLGCTPGAAYYAYGGENALGNNIICDIQIARHHGFGGFMRDWLDRGTETLATGRFGPEQVAAEMVEGAFEAGPGLMREIEGEWSACLRDAKERGATLFDGPLVRLASWELLEGVLYLSLQKTSFRFFVSTNLRDPSLPDISRADPLGNSAVIVTADGKLVLGKRSGKVHGHSGCFHCIGGHVEPPPRGEGRVDTFASIVGEVVEELNVTSDDIVGIDCHGIVRDVASRQPEQLFTVGVSRSAAELRSASAEHEELLTLEDSPEAVEQFLEKNGKQTVAVARACLRAHAGLRSDRMPNLE